ncbi:cytochrome p450 [Moniliophthora roreri MCA 2997]|uniref:Cytochrome p450 n=2 Tax=Moniliophthora roreri TaxID=221103 RepID=V2WR29_MONRO|nr:cytochrome p450 [Moniliophthora roreri MCA 2997]
MDPVDKFVHAWAKQQIASGGYLPPFTSMQLEARKHESGGNLTQKQEDIIRWCSSALYAGGADTTVSVMRLFFLLMSLYPNVQKRAQAEIDEVVGQDRLPNIGDRDDLPYTNALVKEIVRWAPPAPLGLPHRVTTDDEYMGYRIPEGATNFDPTRYLSDTPQPDPRKFVFGFGRRVCPGAQFAEDSVFFNISRILSTFDISKSVGEDGMGVEPKVEFTSTVTSHVKPFPCRIVLRRGSAGERYLDSASLSG